MTFQRSDAARRWAVAAALVITTAACGDSATVPGAEVRAPITIAASLTPAQEALVAGLRVELSGPGIGSPIVDTVRVIGGALHGTVRVPVGARRTFALRAFDGQGRPTYAGSVTTSVVAGTNPALALQMETAEGSVPIDVTIADHGVTITPAAANVTVNGELTLTANATTDGAPVTAPLTWGALNPALVTITIAPDGRSAVVRGKVAGATRVVASYEGVAAASTITISTAPANQPPVARANGPYAGKAMLPIAFSSSGSSDADGSIVSYAWDFGDGSSSASANPSKVYSAAGNYTVTLTVTDNRGATASSATAATIGPENQWPSAFISGPLRATVGTPITITASGSDLDGTVVGYRWFSSPDGQGQSTTSGSWTRTFATSGTYSISVAAVDNDGAIGRSSSTTLTVDPAPPPSTNIIQVVAGDSHTCALTSGALVYCWGRGTEGQLGDGRLTSSSRPVVVPQPSQGVTYTRLIAGANYTCGVTGTSQVYCWGSNAQRQLAPYTQDVLSRPVLLTRGLATAGQGYAHTCSSTSSGYACYGSNEFGQLGGSSAFSAEPVAFAPPPGTQAAGIVAGGNFTCLYWQTTSSPLQRGMTCRGSITAPTFSSATIAMGSFRAGFGFACANPSSGGATTCWGANNEGQFGNGTFSGGTTQLTNWTPQALGQSHSCGTLSSSSATVCAGSNSHGQLGSGSTSVGSATPVVVSGGVLSGLTAGGRHSCGIRSGQAWCWGDNTSGQVGDGTTTQRRAPVAILSPAP